jgi:hypothetical protein
MSAKPAGTNTKQQIMATKRIKSRDILLDPNIAIEVDYLTGLNFSKKEFSGARSKTQ